MIPRAQAPFWTDPITPDERSLVYYFLVIAGLAMLAQFVRTWTSVNEIGPKYRPAMYASLGVTGAAFLSYVVLTVKFDLGYRLTGGVWQPTKDAIWSFVPRYMDWSITVPLLMVQLVALSTLAGLAATRMRAITMLFAFLMIFTGYLGGVVIDGGRNLGALWTWGIISGLCMVVLYVCIITMVIKARRLDRGSERTRTFTLASVLLIVVWFVYPVVFGFQGYTDREGGWLVGAQVALSVADIIAKVGFGALIHKLAKLRTAEDVRTGEDVHPEAVYVSSDKKSEAIQAPLLERRGGRAGDTAGEEDLLVVVDDVPVGRRIGGGAHR